MSLITIMRSKPAQPLTDEQIWGEPKAETKQACSLKINSRCPDGCCECAKFYFDMIFGAFGIMD